MTPLEQRYRAVLRVLPRSYRQLWEDDMVATFLSSVTDLDDPDVAEFALPSWPEVGSVVLLAVRLRVDLVRSRLGGAGASPTSVVWGDAVRLIALAGLLVHAVIATLNVLSQLWVNDRIPGFAPPAGYPVAFGIHIGWREQWNAGFVWIPAFGAVLLGYRRIARGLGLIAVLPAATHVLADAWTLRDGQPTVDVQASALAASILLKVVPVVALVAGLHRDAPPVRRPVRWMAAYVALLAGTIGAAAARLGGGLLVDEPAIYTAAFLAAAAIHLSSRVRRSAGQGAASALALALIAPVVLATRTASLLWTRLTPADATRSTLTTLGLTQVTIVLVVAVPLALLAARSLRRLRRSPAPTTASAARQD
ncbi:hypothetical protein I6A60_11255 [Frankia sp. AgB1.9]|uniref:hypothetical protein n=1 Tax=unclassified Frankia TaxID=2632575 RepID=UPI0019343669|nr:MULTISPECIES: hypothetical protein [unclassified Frankia]MBL7489701.1 hypothetical protein [Frankia sp. AgW1.1]MBL7548447.1 hypothetical protein [Frankia sp. AgB1.9]MBL7621337.1 hypothetical protein [Frankia sp. AgB1.8]